MKIAVWHNLPSGGAKRALYYHVRGLIERGHIVESWCPSTANHTYLPLNQLISEHIVPFEWQWKTSYQVIPGRLLTYNRLISRLQAMVRHCQMCAEQINHSDFDVLFANASDFFHVTAIGRHVKIPKLLYLPEPCRNLYEASPDSPWAALSPPKDAWWSPKNLRRFFGDLLAMQSLRIRVREEILNAKAFDLILTNSYFSRESILRAYGLEAKVCYLGVDTELFQAKGSEKQKFVVGLGSFGFHKGIDRAIRAIATIDNNKRPDLVWIGNASQKKYQQEIEKLAQSLEVNFIPKINITDEEIVDILSRATVMLYTSRLEPFGFAPLEANACQTPVVAIAEGGIRETIREGINGFLIDDDNPIAIGKAILQFLENSNLVTQIGANARKEIINNWSWSQAVERLEKYLLKIQHDSDDSDMTNTLNKKALPNL